MSNRDHTKKLTMAPAEAARLLRELADELEGGTLKVGSEGAAPGDELRVKVSGKSKEGSASLALKLQWKTEAAAKEAESDLEDDFTPPAGCEIPSYKNIKKGMGSTFKKIRARLREGQIPEECLVELFHRDAELMLHYPKKGRPADIAAFNELSAAFVSAVESGEMEAVQRSVAALAEAEKSCHRKYK